MKISITKDIASFICDKHHDACSLRELLFSLIPSKKHVHLLFQHHDVLCNGKIANLNHRVQSHDQIDVILHDEELDVPAQNLNIQIPYEDDFVLAAIKPSGMLMYGEHKEDINTLVNGVSYHYIQNDVSLPVRPLHRLDYDTSGLVLFSRHTLFQPLLDTMMKERKIHRYYIAVVEGYMKPNTSGMIEKPLAKDRHSSKMRVASHGVFARTHYEVVYANKGENYSVVKLKLDSGRTHQIRVHMAFLHHPLLGDPLYGHKETCSRLALHAYALAFHHPFLDKDIHITSELPDIFSAYLDEAYQKKITGTI